MTDKQACQSLSDHFGISLEHAVDVLNHDRKPIEWSSVRFWLEAVLDTDKLYGAGSSSAWIKTWQLLYSEDFVKRCVKFLSWHRRDHYTEQGTFMKGIHRQSDLYAHIIMNKLYRAAEQWAKARIEGERIKRSMSLKEELELMKEMREAL